MDISRHVFAPFGVSVDGGARVEIDLNAFILRVLLFDEYIVDTIMFRDLAQLVHTFGADGLVTLLQSKVLKIHLSPRTIGQMQTTDPMRGNQAYPVTGMTNGEYLPYLHYDPLVIDIADRDDYIEQSLQNIPRRGVERKTLASLRNAITDQLTLIPDHDPESSQWMRDTILSNNALTSFALQRAVRDNTQTGLFPLAFEYHFRASGQSGYAVDTNLGRLLHLDEYEVHKIFESVILTLGGFYDRLGLMKNYNAISWFSDKDAQLLNADVKLIATSLNSSLQEQRFTRILKLKDLPMIDNRQKINAFALLTLRNSDTCQQFRAWLPTIDTKTDEEVQTELGSFKAALGSLLDSNTMRTVRFILAASIGTYNPALGIALGAADQFIFDKIIPANGPVGFINNNLPPLWKGDPYRT